MYTCGVWGVAPQVRDYSVEAFQIEMNKFEIVEATKVDGANLVSFRNWTPIFGS